MAMAKCSQMRQRRIQIPILKPECQIEVILPILYSIGPYPSFDIWILSFDILVETIITIYAT